MGKRRARGEGSIFRRADGRWTANINVGIVDGKRRRKSVSGETHKEVADRLKALQREQAGDTKLQTPTNAPGSPGDATEKS